MVIFGIRPVEGIPFSSIFKETETPSSAVMPIIYKPQLPSSLSFFSAVQIFLT